MGEPKQKHGIPALISFFWPGLGQIIKGQVLKGFIIMFFMFLSIILVFFLIGIIIAPILWIWNVYDAYNSNKKEK